MNMFTITLSDNASAMLSEMAAAGRVPLEALIRVMVEANCVAALDDDDVYQLVLESAGDPGSLSTQYWGAALE